MHELIGQIVMNKKSKSRGRIIDVYENKMRVNYGGDIATYPFPDALADTLIMADEELQQKYIGARVL